MYIFVKQELGWFDFAQFPKVFDTVYMIGPVGKNVVIIFDTTMLLIAIIVQPVIVPAYIAVNDGIGADILLYNWQ